MLHYIIHNTYLSGLSFQGHCGSGRGEVSKIKGKEKERKVSTRPSWEETKRSVWVILTFPVFLIFPFHNWRALLWSRVLMSSLPDQSGSWRCVLSQSESNESWAYSSHSTSLTGWWLRSVYVQPNKELESPVCWQNREHVGGVHGEHGGTSQVVLSSRRN